MISIKKLKVFNCSINESFHWSKLPKLKEKMSEEKFVFDSYADLSSAYLRSANLRYADLSSAYLRYANLSYANLSSAYLRSANLSSANLSSANLSYADLSSANLSSANLSFANLRSANLSSANLSFANLRSANLSSANLSSADLSFADLCDAKLKPIDDKDVIIKDFMSVSGLGSCNRQTLIFDTNIGIVLQCGCFYGTEAKFKEKVKETHAGTNYEQEYLKMLELAHVRFSRQNEED